MSRFVPRGRPTFVADAKFQDVREILRERGWGCNEMLSSSRFDLAWRNLRNINFGALSASQVVNHIEGANELSEKDALALHLRALPWLSGVDEDSFYPRCRALREPLEAASFLVDCALVAAVGVLRRAACAGVPAAATAAAPPPPLLLAAAIAVGTKAKRRLAARRRRVAELAAALGGGIPPARAHQLDADMFDDDSVTLSEWRALFGGAAAGGAGCGSGGGVDGLAPPAVAAAQLLACLCAEDAQCDISGDAARAPNVAVIVKPAGLSRGRGVQVVLGAAAALRCAADRNVASEVAAAPPPFPAGGGGGGCVVQQYIEAPLLLEGRKFDIRQWVLITDPNPLVVYMFGDCYARFCASRYDAENLEDRFIHLTNNSVQQANPEFATSGIEGNMLDAAGLDARLGPGTYRQRLRPAMARIAALAITAGQDALRRRAPAAAGGGQHHPGFEWLGFDFMVDAAMRVHLIEINTTPDMSHATPVLQRLVPLAVRDALRLVLPAGAPGAGALPLDAAGAAPLGAAGAPAEGASAAPPAATAPFPPQWELILSSARLPEALLAERRQLKAEAAAGRAALAAKLAQSSSDGVFAILAALRAEVSPAPGPQGLPAAPGMSAIGAAPGAAAATAAVAAGAAAMTSSVACRDDEL
jgi:hypothetical protein